MAGSRATTVEQYLAELPPERREVVETLRELINHHLPEGYVESMAWGMIGWCIPLSRYPDTYNGQPLGILALASQKSGYVLHAMAAYADPEIARDLRAAFARGGLRLDMGKACIRFRSLDALPLDAIAHLVERVGVDEYIARYEAMRAGARPARRAAPKKAKPAAKRATPARVAGKKPAKKRAAAGAKPAKRRPAAKRTAKKRR